MTSSYHNGIIENFSYLVMEDPVKQVIHPFGFLFLFLVWDVGFDHYLIRADGGDKIAAGPELVPDKVATHSVCFANRWKTSSKSRRIIP
jgi:hypothetical protein